MKTYTKPSVNDPNYYWAFIDVGTPSAWHTPVSNDVEVYVQEDEVSTLDHYRLKVNGKWIRKTFFGETAWMDVERYARDEYGVDIRV